jgi:hypothetical protein
MQATPRPLLGPRAEARPDRVVEDVVECRGEVFVAVDDAGVVAIAEQVTPAFVAPVEPQGVDTVQAVEPARHRVDCRLEDEVVVRRHQAVRVELPLEAVDALPEERQEARAVEAVAEDRPVVDADGRDVEHAVGQLRTEDARHREQRTPAGHWEPSPGTESHTFVTKARSTSSDPLGPTRSDGGKRLI